MFAAASITGEVESALHGVPDAQRADLPRRAVDLLAADARANTREQTSGERPFRRWRGRPVVLNYSHQKPAEA